MNSLYKYENPIFVGGDGRSGTTLLSVILDSHSMLAVGPELHFNGPENLGSYVIECLELLIANDPRSYGKGLKENRQFKLGTQFAKRCHRFGIEFDELLDLIKDAMRENDTDFDSFEERCTLINSIGEYVKNKNSKTRWGIKIMREIKNIYRYGKIWPQAQFIHIIRDGRDVAASQMKEHGTWGYEDIEKAAKGWVDVIEKTKKNAKNYSLYEVKYEDLVLQPEKTIRRILSFLNIPWEDTVLRHSEMEHAIFDNPYNHASIDTVVKPINHSAVGRYKEDLDIEQIKVFNKIAEKQLKQYGYSLSD